MRILFAYQFCTLGGVETILGCRMRELAAMGVDARAWFLRGGEGLGLFSAFAQKLLVSACADQVGRYLHAFAPEFVLAIDTPQVIGFLGGAPAATLIYEVHTTYRESLGYLGREQELQTVSALLVPSRAQRDLVAALLPPTVSRPVWVAPNPLPHLFLEPPQAPHSDRPIVLWVGRLDDHKNWRDMVRVAALVHRRRSAPEFWVVGGNVSGEREAEELLQDVACEGLVGSFRWLPAVEYAHMPSLYSLAARSGGCLLSTSRAESFGMAALEAVACGCPAVVPDVGGFTDVVPDGVGGVRYPPGDVAAAADHVTALLDDPQRRARLAEAGCDRALKQFAPRVAVEKLLALLRRLPRSDRAVGGAMALTPAGADAPGGRR